MSLRWVVMVLGLVAWAGAARGAVEEDIPRAEHPRPDLRRDDWLTLNGSWQFRFDPEDLGLQGQWQTSGEGFDRRIVVPFCWESSLSGIADTSGQKIGWYRRTVEVPEAFQGKHVWLRFGAVDWQAAVWVNGQELGRHEGGYSPFEFDITELAPPGKSATVVVRVYDATDPELPLGKQVPGWYTPVSGIWQSVWLEARATTYVDRLRLTPRCRKERWSLEVELDAVGPDGPIEIEVTSPDSTVQQDRGRFELKEGRGAYRASLEVKTPTLWTPEDPHLYDLEIRLGSADAPSDTVHTYFGLRTIGRGKYGDLAHEVILLNGEPVYLRGALDQSFNPEGIYTAPSDAFMRRDVEIAKAAGFNFLRIHIKAEEPRRLYWADRMGVLIMEDMPCTFKQSERARRAWESEMRATIERDYNHPSVFAWCLFNETWGLGGRRYQSDRDTQDWVLRMWTEVKEKLDPTRLVEDNSACLYDHVATDVNSWHFYIDDDRRAREHIAEVVEKTRPGSPFNYVPGKVQGTAPLINSEYGAVSASGGDRDVSWGFRDLTTQLRRHELIQGYVYTELSDIEWEHNGVVNYDRSAKEFGYDAFVPGMTLADLQGADFVGFDTMPVLELAPGEEVTVPIFVSHFSARTGTPALRWWITGTDDQGEAVSGQRQTVGVIWDRCRVTFQSPLRVSVPAGRPFVGALVLELLDAKGKRIAANFVNLIVRRFRSEPSADERRDVAKDEVFVKVLGPRSALVRFDPGAFASFRTDDVGSGWLEDRGKFYAHGACEVEYHLALPSFICDALPTQVTLMAELATKADDQLLDWPAERRSADYPQTQDRKYPGKVSVRLLNSDLWQFNLPDDPADARGVLSHQARYQHGSYGYLVRQQADLTKHVALREALRNEAFVPLVFRAVDGHGLSIYGRRLGRYPIDPVLIIRTALELARPVGWSSTQRVTIHSLLDESRHCRQTEGGQGIDLGIGWIEREGRSHPEGGERPE
ncbi:MAG: hypothetical protein A2V70_04985 [Planctomycetes bacterium RBG_13_63_9]|nr:MAG: hypothetical protein A2V70_04985 [Planctomycetes bacterium RBG_13_63_9]